MSVHLEHITSMTQLVKSRYNSWCVLFRVLIRSPGSPPPTLERSCCEEGGREEKAVHERPATKNYSESQAIHGGKALPGTFLAAQIATQKFTYISIEVIVIESIAILIEQPYN